MKIFHALVLSTAVILDLIGMSIQFECLPNGGPIPGGRRTGKSPSSSSDTQRSPDKSIALAQPSFPTRHSSPGEPSLRGRSRSPHVRNQAPPTKHITPPTRISSISGHGYDLMDLQSIRLTPHKNLHRHFELQRYTFPADNSIELHAEKNVYVSIPTGEQIVLSTSDGDVFAILESSTLFAGIYKYNSHFKKKRRAKINMGSGEITPMASDEVMDSPVGPTRPILLNFIVERLNHSHPRN